ncbi:OadG-related small transporter subunit [Streptococcus sp. ZJ99]
MMINMDHLIQAFELMGLGMLGIFVVLGILYISAEVLIKLFPSDK